MLGSKLKKLISTKLATLVLYLLFLALLLLIHLQSLLMGSSFFVRDSLFDFSKVKLMLNLDLLCGGDDGFMVVNSQAENTKGFYDSLVKMNAKKRKVKEIKSRPNAANSDHYPFAKKGMPAVFVYTLGGQTGGYHQPDDTPENASLTQYHNIVSLLIKGVEGMCK